MASVAPRIRVPTVGDTGPRLLDSGWVERTAVADVDSLLGLFSDLGLTGPTFVRLALLHGGKMRFQTGAHGRAVGTRSLDRNALTLGTVVSDEAGDAARLLRPAFDTLWNAFGFDGSGNYSPEGQWMRPAEI
jgi:hypothetical protein